MIDINYYNDDNTSNASQSTLISPKTTIYAKISTAVNSPEACEACKHDLIRLKISLPLIL